MNDDIIGRRFGMLVVQSEAEPVRDARGHFVRMYNCLCDCGVSRVFRYNNLMSGLTNSCGCTRIPQKPPVDLTGRRFGRLTVLFETTPHYEKCGKKMRKWACACDCGTEKGILQSNLISPHGVRSCGCAQQRRGPSREYILVGNRYGRLIVTAQAEPSRRPNGHIRKQWQCVCDCGNETIVAEDNLLTGHTRSCGCMKRNGLKKMRFGMLTVISKPIKGERIWTCRCDCGNEITVDQDDLFWGAVADCGCRQRGTKKVDLTGQCFGMLTVLRETEHGTGSDGRTIRHWLCRCDCGREVIVRQGNLTNKVTRSCGCLRNVRQRKKKESGR